MNRRIRDRWIYRAVWAGCFLPLPLLVWWGAADRLGADPIKEGIHYLGEWGLRFLVIGLALTPLRRLFGWTWQLRFRRTIGLFAFTYIALHLVAYTGADQGFDWAAIWADIVKRPYITYGMIAFAMLVPLAITSTNAMVRRLGGRRWRNLHRLVYIVAPLGVLHYDLLVKADTTWPYVYGAIVAALLGLRLLLALRAWLQRRRPSAPTAIPRGTKAISSTIV
jgi:sulfoxide reductase heme-binding subunit YedZ